ncbi:MAG: ATP-binding protein, partial [Raoultibacter sp.]
YRGIAKGVFDLIANRTGLEFEFVQSETYQQALDLVLTGEADVMGAFMDDEYVASDMSMALTNRYTTLDEVVLRNRSSEYPSEGLIFALPEGRSKTEVVKASQIAYYATYEACLEAVNAGEADITSMPSSYAEGLYVDHYYANVTPVAVDHIEVTLSIAFAQPVDSRLYSVMNKAVNSFTDEEMETVLSRNVVSVANRQISIQSLLYDNPVATLAVGMILLLLVIGIILLIARSKIRNRILELKLEKAEETGRAKSDFLSRMSHEIRTPMNAIIGLSTIASQSDEATPRIKTSLAKINTSAQFLLALVNDILDMSKIENQKMKLECAPFSVEELADQMQSMVGIQAEEKGLMMVTECNAGTGCVVGDSIRIQQVLANLLSNAFKFTDAGGAVVLSIREVARRDSTVRLRFGVKDTGIGIAPDDLERVFESFEQAAENRTNVQGTGLGLAISANLVRMMGGALKVDSTLGKGSEFYFSINLPVSEECDTRTRADVAEAIKHVSLQGCHLLLAEDNDLNAEIAIALLEMEGMEVSRAVDGQQVVDLFVQSEPGSIDFILMDVKMPIKDGLEAATEIRDLDRTDAKTVPIIAITANTFQEDRDSAKAAGMNGFVPKPFDAEQLYDVLREHKLHADSAG